MSTQTPIIEPLKVPVREIDLHDLSCLLVDTIESGAAVSFLAPLSLTDAEDWWRTTISTASG